MDEPKSLCGGYESKQKTAAGLIAKVGEELGKGRITRKNLVWLELTGCSGNIISLLNGANPDFQYLITQMTNLTGPLARQWLSGEYRNGISTMDRTIARVLEAKKIAEVMHTLLENLLPNVSVQAEYEIPENAVGAGLVDTTRGSLGHWLKIANQVISFYQIITPSAWNLSTRSSNVKGTAEQALVGTTVQDIDQPVELGRIIRSFDPCVSCATHVYSEGKHCKTIQVVP